MKLSTRSRYGVRLMIELALNHQNGFMQLSTISQKQDISLKYLGQIVIQLKGAGLVMSGRGKNGGYSLSKSPSDINLRQVVEVLEGGISLVECIPDSDCSRAGVCVTREIWKQLSDDMASKLEKISLQYLADKSAADAANNYCI
ncbi:MAG: Rrf2 family transcriptional regulator [Spirochaetes bacterium]|nr:Rrf2 family transcriptional regulator [Spirochaetota bacterium]